MSVDTLLRDEQIQKMLAPLLPRERWPTMRLKAKPGRNSGPLVGTAFDYAARFEFQRRHPGAHCSKWIAEEVLDLLSPIAGADAILEELSDAGEVISSVDSDLLERWTKVVREARAFQAVYLQVKNPDAAAREQLARHALRLARIDPYRRSGYVEYEPETVEEVDLKDLLELLRITAWSELHAEGPLWLNPTFGQHSKRVGGADCDLISGDRLIDLKATTNPAPSRDFGQVILYLLLARAAHRTDPKFPRIGSVGVYYARHRELRLLQVEKIARPDVLDRAERRLFARADQLLEQAEEEDELR
jgi:hypothetical protein